ncbi:hypothetical protein KSD_44070 [Ktedonobacter sp. SOSP1-85]|nr:MULTISPECIES: hypothetical protein [Ktedonobacter]GHO51946.1 hypothetical protein KSB_04210 [Ktedonobacter robiniae]GHO76636.1 hypothetical protein KSD_44070 [Ktedonobacter sp. SOSP1-85]
MAMRRFFAPSLSLLFGLYCIGWSIVASSSPTSMRVGGAFFGVLLLALAFVYLRIILPQEQRENHAP